MRFLAACLLAVLWMSGWAQVAIAQQSTPQPNRPNFVFAIADDWGWPHASAYGDHGVSTPTFDSIAERGVLFQHAFVSSPSCTPSRGAIITGQHFWRLGAAANLWSEWPHQTFPEYPSLLRESGYFVGHFRKAWGPGKFVEQPAGRRFKSPQQFLDERQQGQPFCFWFGASDPHRGYEPGSGQKSGIDLESVHLFPHFPDTPEIRSDIADYFFEVQRFDRQLGEFLKLLEQTGELDNTWIVVTGDHGMPFPRCKTNLYDSGTRVPLAICGPGIRGGRVLTDFVSLTDIAPTFLDAAGLPIPDEMTGRSLAGVLRSDANGRADSSRDHVIFGRERHTVGQEKGNRGGYPMRAIRNDDWLLVHNLFPDRWPAGTPDFDNAEFKRAWLSDCDNGPTKQVMWDIRESAEGASYYELSFGKRPKFELYDMQKDPGQTTNIASEPEYNAVFESLYEQLYAERMASGDPRANGAGEKMDQAGKYLGGGGGQWKK